MINDIKTQNFEHVLYEIHMFAHTTSYLSKLTQNDLTIDDYVYLESWTIHLRILIEFFSANPKHDDIVYTDFISKSVENKEIIKDFDEVKKKIDVEIKEIIKDFDDEKKLIDKHLAHLTEYRNNFKEWDYFKKYREIIKAYRIFLKDLEIKYSEPYRNQIFKINEFLTQIDTDIANKNIDYQMTIEDLSSDEPKIRDDSDSKNSKGTNNDTNLQFNLKALSTGPMKFNDDIFLPTSG